MVLLYILITTAHENTSVSMLAEFPSSTNATVTIINIVTLALVHCNTLIHTLWHGLQPKLSLQTARLH